MLTWIFLTSAFSIQHLAFGIWHLAFSIQHWHSSAFSPDVFEIARSAFDAALGRGDIVRELSRLVHGLGLDAEEVLAVLRVRQPLVLPAIPLRVGERLPDRIEVRRGE